MWMVGFSGANWWAYLQAAALESTFHHSWGCRQFAGLYPENHLLIFQKRKSHARGQRIGPPGLRACKESLLKIARSSKLLTELISRHFHLLYSYGILRCKRFHGRSHVSHIALRRANLITNNRKWLSCIVNHYPAWQQHQLDKSWYINRWYEDLNADWNFFYCSSYCPLLICSQHVKFNGRR